MKGELTFRLVRSIGVSVGAGNDPLILNGVVGDIFFASLPKKRAFININPIRPGDAE